MLHAISLPDFQTITRLSNPITNPFPRESLNKYKPRDFAVGNGETRYIIIILLCRLLVQFSKTKYYVVLIFFSRFSPLYRNSVPLPNNISLIPPPVDFSAPTLHIGTHRQTLAHSWARAELLHNSVFFIHVVRPAAAVKSDNFKI